MLQKERASSPSSLASTAGIVRKHLSRVAGLRAQIALVSLHELEVTAGPEPVQVLSLIHI